MTVRDVALFLVGTAILSLSLVAAYAASCWREASRSTRKPKSAPELPPTPGFDARLAKLEADQVALFSVLEKINSEMRRISARQVRREEREEARATPAAAPAEPPPGSPRSVTRAFYKITGKTPAEVAKIHQNPHSVGKE